MRLIYPCRFQRDSISLLGMCSLIFSRARGCKWILRSRSPPRARNQPFWSRLASLGRKGTSESIEVEPAPEHSGVVQREHRKTGKMELETKSGCLFFLGKRCGCAGNLKRNTTILGGPLKRHKYTPAEYLGTKEPDRSDAPNTCSFPCPTRTVQAVPRLGRKSLPIPRKGHGESVSREVAKGALSEV